MANQVWVWNDVPAYSTSLEIDIDFVNSGIAYNVLLISRSGPNGAVIYYGTSDASHSAMAWDGGANTWGSPAYRAIVFKTPPTGNLLTYLQENATQM